MYVTIRNFINNFLQTIFKTVDIVVKHSSPLEMLFTQHAHQSQVVTDLLQVQDHAAIQANGWCATIIIWDGSALILTFSGIEAVDVTDVDDHIDQVGAQLVRLDVDGIGVGRNI